MQRRLALTPLAVATGLVAAVTGDPPTVQAAGEPLVCRYAALLFQLLFMQILMLSMQSLVSKF